MNELVSIFMFWVAIVAPGGIQLGADVHGYRSMEVCEAAREIIEAINSDMPGFHIAPECIEIPVPPTQREDGDLISKAVQK